MATYVEVRTSDNLIVSMYLNANTAPTPGDGFEVYEVTQPHGTGLVQGQVFDVETGAIIDTATSLAHAARDDLNNSDWKVIRHRDQVDAGIPTSLTDEEYQSLLAWRQERRNAVNI